ncbi:MAG: helix-turn-helix domain-containing protein [Deltaproteobacteria bacterium]|nr:helix-turn-helix domain-containing protein [Deltaproteobacteria bacterium]
MSRIAKGLGPRNKAEKLVFVAERLRVDVQCDIQKLMRVHGISKKKLRRLSGITKKQCRRLLDDRHDIGIKVLARVYYALGWRCRVTWGAPRALPPSKTRP